MTTRQTYLARRRATRLALRIARAKSGDIITMRPGYYLFDQTVAMRVKTRLIAS